MKRRLRPSIQRMLEITLFILIGFVACIADFSLSALMIIAMAMLLIFVIGHVLTKYGKYEG